MTFEGFRTLRHSLIPRTDAFFAVWFLPTAVCPTAMIEECGSPSKQNLKESAFPQLALGMTRIP